jgi:hypothetical protein
VPSSVSSPIYGAVLGFGAASFAGACTRTDTLGITEKNPLHFRARRVHLTNRKDKSLNLL